MKKMSLPKYAAISTFDTCVNAIGNPANRVVFTSNRGHIEIANNNFSAAQSTPDWISLPKLPKGNHAAVVAGTLTKGQLMSLYTDQMVGTSGPSRDIYDNIFTAAGGFCPFCGGLGQVKTLDHYLPKAIFPAYSVHPCNLVPCCRDCNTGKNSTFGNSLEDQALHPYLDHVHFFEERWVVAKAIMQNPILIEFSCMPPANWSQTDKGRAVTHFDSYHLADRFSIQAGSEISRIVDTRANSLRKLSAEDYRSYLLDNANAPGFVLNGWSRSMYAALADTDWFLNRNFSDPNWHLP